MTPRQSMALAVVLVAIASLRIVATYHIFSFTIDEPGHFACGVQYLAAHVYSYWPEQPPLSRAAVALPPYLAGMRPLGEENYNVEGRDLIVKSPRPGRTLALMRLGTLPFFWLACLVVYRWCRRDFGDRTAVFAVALLTLEPSLLAHAGLACTDMALAATVGAAFLALVRWAASPHWKRAVLLGVTTALAVLSKFTALLDLPSAAGLALVFYLAAERQGVQTLAALIRKRAATFALAIAVGAITIWAAYWFSYGPVPQWRLNLPAPELFQGLLLAQEHNRGGHPSYLLGHYGLKGWWYYFPVVLAVKTTIPALILAAVGVLACCRKFAVSASRLPVAFSLGVLIPAMIGNVDIGVRHILPIYIGFSILGAIALSQAAGRQKWIAFALLIWLGVESLAAHPDYISYFNEIAGRDPSRILVDSNLDWGQDTKRLGQRLKELGVEHISVMLIEPLTLPLPVEESIRRLYGLPPLKLIDAMHPATGWNVISPTVARTLDLRFQPWWDRIPPTEKVGALWLYNFPP